MAEVKWSKGPWRKVWKETNKRLKLGHWFFVGSEKNIYLGSPTGESEANANLIAAAPEMYAALEKSVKHMEMLHSEDAYGSCGLYIDDCSCDLAEDRREALAALDKARGER